MIKKTDILELISRKLAPFVFLFGCYLISFGHLSPGGGFQGGAVLASGVIMLCLGHGTLQIENLIPMKRIALLEASSFFLLLGVGMAGLISGGMFLENVMPQTDAAEIPAVGFIFLLNIIIGLKVGTGISLACLALFKEE